MQAIILAAGMGQRIRAHHSLPKGFISLGQKAIVVESIERLQAHGIRSILLVTGYQSDAYQQLVAQLPGVETIHNPDFEKSGSLYSLYCARDWVREEVLIVESDLIYESNALSALIQSPKPDAILVSGWTNSGDEVYVQAHNDQLTGLSKQKNNLEAEKLVGEFVGINKLSLDGFRSLIDAVSQDHEALKSGHYEEQGLVALSKHRAINCLKVENLLWAEIDDTDHLARAKQIYPQIKPSGNTMQRNILLNPGPVTTTETVKKAQCVSDICHREKEFTDLLRGIRDDLLKVVEAPSTKYTSVLFTASGTGAIESVISSVVPKGKKLAVINNGSYGQRLLNIAKRYDIETVEISFEFDEIIDMNRIKKQLSDEQGVAYLAMVHHETSSGILNPLTEIGKICRELNCGFIVDAMSSFAGSDINVERDQIDFLISSSNKCLHGMPGLSFVIARLPALLESEQNARSYYFDLYQQYRSLEESGQMPFTPAVQVAYALRQAIDELLAEGVSERIQHYHELHQLLVSGLEQLGFSMVTPEEQRSQLLVTVRFPQDGRHYDFDHFHDYLYQRGYTVYPKKLALEDTFRLAVLGDLHREDIQRFIQLVQSYCLTEVVSHV